MKWGWIAAAMVATAAFARAVPVDSGRMLDRFNDLAAWAPAASNGVAAAIEPAEGPHGAALRLDFDLGGTAGYALAARALPLDLPPNYELTLWIRAEAAANDLQIKLVDASGDNVWWFHRRNYAFPRTWQRLKIRKRQIEFAWGPIADHELRHAARIELVVAAGRGGGAGSIWFSDLRLHELPVPPAHWPQPIASATSSLANSPPALAFDGSVATAWRSDPARGAEQSLTVDLGMEREFGGLIVHWQQAAYASRYDVELSADGQHWRTVRSVSAGRGGPDALLLPDSETRFVRLALHGGPTNAYALAELEIEDVAFGASPNAFFQAVSRTAPRGWYPRGFSSEQAYWTIVGVDGGADTGLLSEDGALEASSGGFSIEPLIVADGRVTTWADVAATQSLADGYLPLPSVTWRKADWRLEVEAFATGTRARSQLVARYTLTNGGLRPVALRLVLALRPFQVNPPAQLLNVEGGVSRIGTIDWNGTALAVDGKPRIYPLRVPDRVAMAPFDGGPVARWLVNDDLPVASTVRDPFGYASGALVYDIALAPGASTTVDVVMPLSGAPPALERVTPDDWVAGERAAVAATWKRKLDRVGFDVPGAAQPLIDTLRGALAHILEIRDGPILRPGTRAYARSWIRDGAMMSEALFALGHATAAVEYLRWFAPHQFADGRIPCCVDRRGADPVAENDSDGEFLFLVDEAWRYTRERRLLDAMWPHVIAAVRHLETMRASSEANDASAAEALRGLLPASISHEGYAAKPMHSYWDDFWAAKGLAAAVNLARAQGAVPEAERWSAAEADFRRDLERSLRAARKQRGISYIPGAAELGDFDPSATAIAFAPGIEVLDSEAPEVSATFERYWREFVARRDGTKSWREYTPYEIRLVGAFVRLGWRERAQELLAFFLDGRRPAGWNQWAEVVGRDPREPRFVGDMPHGWIESDFIRAVVDLFAYERVARRSIVIGRGLPPSWLDGRGVAVRNLRTPYGSLSYSLRRARGRTTLTVDARSTLPPGGFAYVGRPGQRATVNGKPTTTQGGEVKIAELPAVVVVNDP
jgi:hypothetical protein